MYPRSRIPRIPRIPEKGRRGETLALAHGYSYWAMKSTLHAANTALLQLRTQLYFLRRCVYTSLELPGTFRRYWADCTDINKGKKEPGTS